MLNDYLSDATTLEGVKFTVVEGFYRHECIVLHQALYLLSGDADSQNVAAIYRRHEHQIQRAARRLINAGQSDKPLVIGPWSFRPQTA